MNLPEFFFYRFFIFVKFSPLFARIFARILPAFCPNFWFPICLHPPPPLPPTPMAILMWPRQQKHVKLHFLIRTATRKSDISQHFNLTDSKLTSYTECLQKKVGTFESLPNEIVMYGWLKVSSIIWYQRNLKIIYASLSTGHIC